MIDGNTVEVTCHAGDSMPHAESWDAWPGSSVRYLITPRDDVGILSPINGVETFSVSVASMPEFTSTFELAANGFWETPVQPDFDICDSKPSS